MEDEEFNPEKFVELLEVEISQSEKDKEKLIEIFRDIISLFNNIYVHSDDSKRDRRKKIRDNLIYVEDNFKQDVADIKSGLGKDPYIEFEKFIEKFKNRNNDYIFGVSGGMYDMHDLSGTILKHLKNLKEKKFPNENFPFAIDFD